MNRHEPFLPRGRQVVTPVPCATNLHRLDDGSFARADVPFPLAGRAVVESADLNGL